MWHRVFGSIGCEPSPAALVDRLRGEGLDVIPHFKGDDLGWTEGELHLPVGGSPVLLARYLTAEDDLRDDLNGYAAELETMDFDPNHRVLMERVIQTQQLITIRKPVDQADEVMLDRLVEATMRHLAMATSGVYQIDRQGWFAADGTKLLTEY
jgi:hypothetical protein